MDKLKDIIRKVFVFKDYSPLLVPVVLVVVAVLLFIPTQLMSSKLKQQMNSQSISKYKQLRSLIETAPAGGQWEEEKKYQQAYRKDANEIAFLAQQSAQRQLLSYNLFPDVKDESALVFKEFGQQFRAGVDKLLGLVNARDCPTKDELEKHLKSPSGTYSSGTFGPEWTSGSVGLESTIRDALCVEKAESASIYANPAYLSGYEYWGDYRYVGPTIDDAVEDCWYWQLGYWIIEDVIGTIEALNSGSDSVFTSPVKRLIFVNFSAGERVGSLGEISTGGYLPSGRRPSGRGPTYVLSTGEGRLAEPCTGRACNDEIDVVHFNVRVLVSAKAVPSFMQQLCSAKQHKFSGWFGSKQERGFEHNQITILRSRIEPINREGTAHNLYRYGEDAVVQLDLICEYIFNKSAYNEVKPESVKKSLEQEQQEQQPGQPVQQGQPQPARQPQKTQKPEKEKLEKELQDIGF